MPARSFLRRRTPSRAADHGAQAPVEPASLSALPSPTSGTEDGPRAERGCPNCGTPAPLAYCPACGQAQHALHRSLRAWAAELLDTFAGWDGKIPRTLWLLFRHPGRLTAEYLAGRRARYLPPLRLYLSLAVVLVLARRVSGAGYDGAVVNFDLGTPARVAAPASNSPPAPNSPPVPRPASGAAPGAASTARPAPRPAGELDPSLTASGPWQKMKRWGFGARLDTLERMSKAERNAALRASFLGKLGNMFFALVPAFALLVAGLYWRRPFVYAEHLVFALHVHAFAAGALALLFALPKGGWRVPPMLWLAAYLPVALRAVYGGSRVGALARAAVLGLGYLIALLAAVVVTGMLALLVG